MAPWQLGPFLLLMLIATLAMLAIPTYQAHPMEVTDAVKAACDTDVRTLCPREHARRSSVAICRCMSAQASSAISWKCKGAWIKEYGLKRAECK